MLKYKVVTLILILVLGSFPLIFIDNEVKGGEAESLTFNSSVSDGCAYVHNSNYVICRTQSTGALSTNSIYIGQAYTGSYYIYRGFVFFDTSSIPDDVNVTSAKLVLRVATYTSEHNYSIVIQSGMDQWPTDPLVSGDYYYTHYSGDGGSASVAGLGSNDYLNITLNSTGLDWINDHKDGTTKFCLRSSKDISSTAPIEAERTTFYDRNQGIIKCPKLIVYWNYSTIPDTPSAPTVDDDFFPIGQTINISAVATDDDGDNLSMQFDYGDGNTSSWTGLKPNGSTFYSNYFYSNNGTFDVKVKSRDQYGNESSWSDVTPVTVYREPREPQSLTATNYTWAVNLTWLPPSYGGNWSSFNYTINYTVDYASANYINFSLLNGYNLITIPFINASCDTAAHLSSEIPYCTHVYDWVGANQTYDTFITGVGGVNFDIQMGKAYLIAISHNTSWNVSGTLGTSWNVTLYNYTGPGTGYNYIGWLQPTNILAEDLGNMLTNCDVVMRMDTLNDSWETHSMGTGSNNFLITRGMGVNVRLFDSLQYWEDSLDPIYYDNQTIYLDNVTSYNHSVVSSSKHHYWLRANNDYGSSDWVYTYGTPLVGPPTPPTLDITYSGSSINGDYWNIEDNAPIQLTWSGAGGLIDYYKIYQKNGSGSWFLLGLTSSENYTINSSDLTVDRTYYWNVTAYDDENANESVPSNNVNLIVDSTDPVISSLDVSLIDKVAIINWTILEDNFANVTLSIYKTVKGDLSGYDDLVYSGSLNKSSFDVLTPDFEYGHSYTFFIKSYDLANNFDTDSLVRSCGASENETASSPQLTEVWFKTTQLVKSKKTDVTIRFSKSTNLSYIQVKENDDTLDDFTKESKHEFSGYWTPESSGEVDFTIKAVTTQGGVETFSFDLYVYATKQLGNNTTTVKLFYGDNINVVTFSEKDLNCSAYLDEDNTYQLTFDSKPTSVLIDITDLEAQLFDFTFLGLHISFLDYKAIKLNVNGLVGETRSYKILTTGYKETKDYDYWFWQKYLGVLRKFTLLEETASELIITGNLDILDVRYE